MDTSNTLLPLLTLSVNRDTASMSSMAQFLCQEFSIKIITTNVTNHRYLLVEHGIKSLSNTLTKHPAVLDYHRDNFIGLFM